MKTPLLALSLLTVSAGAGADDVWVTQYRAAPGKFPALLELVTTTEWNAFEEGMPILMRHSQGNHWDLMLMGRHKQCIVDTCAAPAIEFDKAAKKLVDFELSFSARTDTSWPQLQLMAADAGMYHIEMFQAGAGKHAALMRQRIIENDYLARTGQLTNVIFEVTMGSDIDIFTIGFHESLSSYAAQGPENAEAAEAAAIAAGFKNRADISFHLRELIVGHHDTLAVPVK